MLRKYNSNFEVFYVILYLIPSYFTTAQRQILYFSLLLNINL